MSALPAPPPATDDDATAAWELHLDDPAAALARARAVHATPEAHGERAVAWAELTEGFHRLLFTGGPLEAKPWLESARRRLLAAGDQRGALLADAGRARIQVHEGEALAARARLEALLRDAGGTLAPRDLFWVLNTLSATFYCTDQLDEAIRCLYEALELLRSVEASPQLATVLSNLAAALVTVGDYAPARELAQEALDLLRRHRNPELSLYARSNLAEALAGTGDWAGALATVDDMLALRDPARLAPQNHYCAIAAEVLARHGRTDEALRCASDAETVHARAPGPFSEVYARWARACAASAAEGPLAALGALSAAADAATQRRHLPVMCKAYAALSERCAALGRYEQAWRAQKNLFDANQQRLLNRASARYYLLRVEHELTHARAERDRELGLRRESESLNRQLADVNAKLSSKMREVEELQSRLALEAVHDPLTGLFNRRYLDAAMPGLSSAAERKGTPLTLALIDLDHFKRVNDRHGHLAGDKVLRRIGKLLAGSLRPSDIVARWGGEEFCAIFPATDVAGAATALASLAARLRTLQVEWAGSVIGGFTFSAALAAYGQHGRTLAELVAAADDALYAAKGAGRDRVLVARPGASLTPDEARVGRP